MNLFEVVSAEFVILLTFLEAFTLDVGIAVTISHLDILSENTTLKGVIVRRYHFRCTFAPLIGGKLFYFIVGILTCGS